MDGVVFSELLPAQWYRAHSLAACGGKNEVS